MIKQVDATYLKLDLESLKTTKVLHLVFKLKLKDMDVVYAVAGLVVDLIASVVLGVVFGVALCPSWTSF